MALYTGKMELADGIVAPMKSDRLDGLFPTIVADESGHSLGLAYSSRESIRLAVERQQGTHYKLLSSCMSDLATFTGVYHSRTRGVWIKGETSGAMQDLLGIKMDCDRDTLLFTVCNNRHNFGVSHP